MSRRIWLQQLLGFATASLSGRSLPAANVVRNVMPNGAASAVAVQEFQVGLGVSLHDRHGPMRLASSIGATSIRADAPWSEIERVRGEFVIPTWLEKTVDDALENGMEPLLILAYGNPNYGGDKPRSPEEIEAFVRYAVHVVSHFRGRVRLFDLWNEWETRVGKTTPGSALEYVRLANVAYPAIKRANPECVVLSGGVSDPGLRGEWFEDFLRGGGLQLIDALSIHPYNWHRSDGSDALAAYKFVAAVLSKANGYPLRSKGELPCYVTEMGYPTFEGRRGTSPELAAWYLAQFLLLCSTLPQIRGVWWYGLRDQGTDRSNKEHNFGVFDFHHRPKPMSLAFNAVSALLRRYGRGRLIEDKDIVSVAFGSNPPSLLVSWSTSAKGFAATAAGGGTPLFGEAGSSLDGFGMPRLPRT